MSEELRNYLFEQWRERADAKHLFRGMSSRDLIDPLDPSFDPFQPIRAKLYRLIGILQRLLDGGFRFTVYEDYSGLSFDLRNILLWTKRDLDSPGIDFTSSYESACGHAKNFQGSQLKQNFKYITDHLPERRSDPLVQAAMDEEDWRFVSEINDWVSRKSPEHRKVVIWVRRSCSAFESDQNNCISIGSLEYFCDKVLTQIENEEGPHTIQSVKRVLARESDPSRFRLVRPLRLKDMERIEEVGNQTSEVRSQRSV